MKVQICTNSLTDNKIISVFLFLVRFLLLFILGTGSVLVVLWDSHQSD